MNLLRTGRAIATQFSLSFSSPTLLRNSLYSTSTAVNFLKKKKPPEEIFISQSPELQSEIQDPVSKFEEIRVEMKSSSRSVNWPRPSEIPMQGKVANSINLIGRLKMPIQFHTSSDGKSWAATVIAQENSKSSAPSLRIPLIFEGDLAHVASCHLKEEDHVYIDGQLSADRLPFTLNCEQSSLQVCVQNVNFVDSSPSKRSWSNRKYSVSSEISKTGNTNRKKESMPHEWIDISLKQPNPASGAFEQKEDGKLVDMNKSTPNWTKEKAECVTFDCKSEEKNLKRANMPNNGDSTENLWRDLLKNPKQWCDYRENKLNGSVKPKHPDFKNKDSRAALWEDSAPNWVKPGLKGLDFNVPYQTVKKPDDNSWRDLVENPRKWWDNRSNKRNPKSPDFKHKESGVALWLTDSPDWAESMLPPLKS